MSLPWGCGGVTAGTLEEHNQVITCQVETRLRLCRTNVALTSTINTLAGDILIEAIGWTCPWSMPWVYGLTWWWLRRRRSDEDWKLSGLPGCGMCWQAGIHSMTLLWSQLNTDLIRRRSLTPHISILMGLTKNGWPTVVWSGLPGCYMFWHTYWGSQTTFCAGVKTHHRSKCNRM